MTRCLVIGVVAAALAAPAAAHVTLETQEAKVGSPYKAVLRVPHGCKGSPTTAVRVRIPGGIIGVKPMPKAGWTLSTTVRKYPKTYKLYHADVTEGVGEISWAGGKLPDAWYEEFVFTGVVAGDLEPGTTLHFPVVQQCETGVHRWIEIPEAGKTRSDYAEPAPELRLLPGAAPKH
jgi:uncharacterized protein YcnI